MITKKDFVYDTNAFSEKAFDSHMKLYKGYVDRFNEICSRLDRGVDLNAANAVYSEYRELKHEQTFALDGVILHEEFFENQTKYSQGVGEKTNKLFKAFFGGYDEWLDDFTACAMSARGWCVTAFDQRSGKLINFLQDVHDQGVITLSCPVIVLDMYEHAYYLDYQTDKALYVKNFIKSINWLYVEEKSAKALSGTAIKPSNFS